jgi:hypothetical protein
MYLKPKASNNQLYPLVDIERTRAIETIGFISIDSSYLLRLP